MENFANRLKQKRKAKNLTQSQLAKLLGMDKHNAVSNWENGIAKPSADDLQKISEILEVSVDWLLKGLEKYIIPQGKIAISQEDYIEYLKYKADKAEKEVATQKIELSNAERELVQSKNH
jgi:transcriptional regulator with XRE-family HTH domain